MARKNGRASHWKAIFACLGLCSLSTTALASDVSCLASERFKGATQREADAPLIVETTTFGGIIVINQVQADEARVAGEIARDRARHFLGLDVPPFVIAAKNVGALQNTGGCAFVMRWVLTAPENGYSKLPSSILPHEIGHQIFIQFLMPPTGEDEYGGSAPDWLDEMAALAFEDARGIGSRRSAARMLAQSNGLIPIDELLLMTHPEWKPRSSDAEPRVWGVPMQPTSSQTFAFYSTIRALFDFLIKETGDEQVIRRLVEHIQANKSVEGWFEENLAVDHSDFSFNQVDADLKAYVLTSAEYSNSDLYDTSSIDRNRNN
ncbi:hypothetical protein [Erythrobacter sp. MTPC3]|uniref:hypothetical protein n=1 Tax=Erythrobacter sp. MTPC3 TaxID=3056564 RepID=UPI0036F42D5F